MDFHVLGPVEAHDGGTHLDIGGPKARALLAALLAHRGGPVSQDRLADALWPESPSPRDALQSYVSRVRRQLGRPGVDIISRTAGGYALDPSGGTDVDRFEALLSEASTVVADDPAAALDLIGRALDLWRGPAYGDNGSDELVHAEAVRLEELRLVALEDRFEIALDLGRHRQVVGELERACDTHPFRERLWELQMLALARSGRQAEALRAYQRVRAVLVDELGIEPSAGLRHAEQLVLAQDTATDPPATRVHRSNLPPDSTVFVGRELEVSAVTRLLSGTRLLTLVGIGGVGKTRLALQAARLVGSNYPGGVRMIDLSPVTDPTEIDSMLADCLASFDGGEDDECLVVLDNCEHLIEACAEAVAETMIAGLRIRFLATSREPLRLRGELQVRVEPMAVPNVNATDAEARVNDSVCLFMECARSVRPSIALNASTRAEVVEICRRLDGIPLAIELAAALVATMGLHEIEQGLADRFELLQSGYRTVSPRQRTLRGTIEWSYHLLDESDKRLLQRIRPLALVPFPGRAVEVICADEFGKTDPAIGATLSRLVDRSLIHMVERSGRATYGVLPTITDFIWQSAGWQPSFEERGFVAHLAMHTEPRLRGTVEEMWAGLLEGPPQVARGALDLIYHLHDLEAGSFLAGAVAARMTSTRRIAFIGGVRSWFISSFETGFRAGVAHVADDVDVEAAYLSEPGDFSGFMNTTRAREVAVSGLERGVDIIFHAAGEVGGQGVYEAVHEWLETTGEMRWVIGVDLDERVTRGTRVRNHVLTSMRRQIPMVAYVKIKEAVAAGRSEQAPALDLANEGVGLSLTGGAIDHLAGEIAEIRAGVINGEIDVPRVTFDRYQGWSGPDPTA